MKKTLSTLIRGITEESEIYIESAEEFKILENILKKRAPHIFTEIQSDWCLLNWNGKNIRIGNKHADDLKGWHLRDADMIIKASAYINDLAEAVLQELEKFNEKLSDFNP